MVGVQALIWYRDLRAEVRLAPSPPDHHQRNHHDVHDDDLHCDRQTSGSCPDSPSFTLSLSLSYFHNDDPNWGDQIFGLTDHLSHVDFHIFRFLV